MESGSCETFTCPLTAGGGVTHLQDEAQICSSPGTPGQGDRRGQVDAGRGQLRTITDYK